MHGHTFRTVCCNVPEVFHVRDTNRGVGNPVVDDRVHGHGHGVAGQDLNFSDASGFTFSEGKSCLGKKRSQDRRKIAEGEKRGYISHKNTCNKSWNWS